MQTELITISCENTETGFLCTTPSIFSGGDMFISLLLLVGLILGIIALVKQGIFSVSVHKEYQGVNQMEGKEKYKI